MFPLTLFVACENDLIMVLLVFCVFEKKTKEQK